MEVKQNFAYESEKYLCFALGKQKYAIPLLQVKEVIANTNITSIPQSPPHFKGLMNLRDQIVSVIDLQTKLKINKTQEDIKTTIIILDLDQLLIGVVVDSVNSVTTIDPSMLSEPPTTDSSLDANYIFAVAKFENELTLLVDLKKILNIEQLKKMKSATEKAA